MPMNITTKSLDHHGIVAGFYDFLEIGDVIDDVMPKKGPHNLPHSIVVKAMVLNALGFTDSRLYMFSRYFETLPTERLLGEGVKTADLNDDIFGRTLDRIYDSDPTELFMKIVLKAMEKLQFGTQLVHGDTTNFSLFGGYENIDDSPAIEITYGHPKDGRTDLKRFVLSMITNQHGFPLFSKSYSGNASDKETILESMRRFKENFHFPEDIYYIADSALYTEDNVKAMGNEMLWISRVPATLKMAKELLNKELMMEEGSDTRYSFYEHLAEYGGIRQKWVLVRSKEMQKSRLKTYEKRLKKNFKKYKSEIKELKREEFACEEDALKAVQKWIKKHPRCLLVSLDISTVSRRLNGGKGRPKKDEKLKISYLVNPKIIPNEPLIREEKKKLGRFILATNDLTLDSEQILEYYKDQNKVERGFRFLKDKSFRVSEVYLKKPERIEALSMIMVLTLFVYSTVEWILRKRLKESGEYIPNQLDKPTQKPTLKWVFMLFMGITEVKIDSSDERQIANLDEMLWKIIDLLGWCCGKYYV